MRLWLPRTGCRQMGRIGNWKGVSDRSVIDSWEEWRLSVTDYWHGMPPCRLYTVKDDSENEWARQRGSTISVSKCGALMKNCTHLMILHLPPVVDTNQYTNCTHTVFRFERQAKYTTLPDAGSCVMMDDTEKRKKASFQRQENGTHGVYIICTQHHRHQGCSKGCNYCASTFFYRSLANTTL